MSKITIGRGAHNDIRIDERWDTVSNQHGELTYENGLLTYIDHSTNGTYINGHKVNNVSVEIRPGDKVCLANSFNLEWHVIERFFPELRRPVEPQRVSRQTIQINVSKPANGRMTEHFNDYVSESTSSAHKKNDENYGQANDYSLSEIDKETEKWNWGAFFCSWLWAVFNGVYWPLFILIIAPIPYAGQVCSLCLSVYLGYNGSKMAWRTGKNHDFKRFKRIQRNWAIGGLIWFFLNIMAYAYILKYTLM